MATLNLWIYDRALQSCSGKFHRANHRRCVFCPTFVNLHWQSICLGIPYVFLHKKELGARPSDPDCCLQVIASLPSFQQGRDRFIPFSYLQTVHAIRTLQLIKLPCSNVAYLI
ncbi:MAG: hypothetical protein ACK4QL_01195 [Pseudanabaenaceae cyanobacterium]